MVLRATLGRFLRVGRIPSLIVTALALAAFALPVAAAQAVTFDPAKIMSDDNFRAYDSMNAADIQAFLNSSPVLASYTATDYPSGKKISAAKIIYNASQKFHINPTVILTLLQKEQSLLTRSKSSLKTGSHATLDWALGMGCPDGYSSCMKSGCHSTTPPDNRYPEYRGFGKQIWAAEWSLDAYGERGKTRPSWHHAKTVYTESSNWTVGTVFKGLNTPTGTTNLAIKNLASFKLYTYNPSIGAKSPYGDLSSQAGKSWMSGNANFWLLYRKNFGDTFANPRIRLVYRFRDTKGGFYLYTASPAERYNLLRNARYKFETVAFSWNTSNTANSVPVYRLMNRKTRGYLFTASVSTYTRLTSKAYAAKWRYEGVGFWASNDPKAGKAVYQFNNKKTGLAFLTTSTSERDKFRTSAYKKTWIYKGVPYWLGQ